MLLGILGNPWNLSRSQHGSTSQTRSMVNPEVWTDENQERGKRQTHLHYEEDGV